MFGIVFVKVVVFCSETEKQTIKQLTDRIEDESKGFEAQIRHRLENGIRHSLVQNG